MEPLTYQAKVARTVSDALETAGLPELTVSQETKIPRTTLQRRLAGLQPFTANELKAIADLCAVPVESLVAVDGAA